MSRYNNYLQEIDERKNLGLNPKPIDDALLLNDIISNIKDHNNNYRLKSINFFIYNVLPGTTSAAKVKSNFLKEIILEKFIIKEIPVS